MAVIISRQTFVGVDLGQRRDASTIVAIEQQQERLVWPEVQSSTAPVYRWWFYVRLLERMRLDTPYPEVVKRIRRVLCLPQMQQMPRTLVVDGTGVGIAVVDMLHRADLDCRIRPMVITGSTNTGSHLLRNGYESIGRGELLTWMQILVQRERLLIPVRCREAETLRKEMLSLKLTSTTTGEHDDIAFAVALALWKAKVRLD